MKELIYMLYNSMNKANIRNRMDSIYWLYCIENLIVKRDGICRRFLKIRFYNRFFNEQDNLMQMKFDFHGQEIIIKRFDIVSEYQNQNLQGLVYEIDLNDESTDLLLKSYIINGKEYILKGELISNIKLIQNQHQMNLLSDYTSDLTTNNIPLITDSCWVCTCGFCNTNESDNCEFCGIEKQKVLDVMKENLAERVYKKPDKFLDLDIQHTLDDLLASYAEFMEHKYGIDKKILLSCMDKTSLKREQDKLIHDKIQEYLDNENLIFSVDMSFEENLISYCEKISGKLITTEMVIRQGSLRERESEYEKLCQNHEFANRKKKKKMILTGICAGTLLVLLISAAILQSPYTAEEKSKNTPVKKVEKREEDIKYDFQTAPQVDAGVYSTIALKEDGTVVSTAIRKSEDNRGQNDVSSWENIVQVSSNEYHTVGLKQDGSVISTQVNTSNDTGQADVEGWKDIVQVSSGTWHTVGLRKDGTVVSTYISDAMYDLGQSNVSDWTDIIQVCAAWDHTIGLKSDGTVVSTKINNKKYDFGETDVFDWTDIVQIATGSNHTLGLKRDGTVVSTGYEKDGRCAVSDWYDVIAISAGRFHSIGLRKDGTVVSTEILDKKENFGQSKVEEWNHVTQISAGWLDTVALTDDGSILYTEITKKEDDNGQTELSEWKLKGGN